MYALPLKKLLLTGKGGNSGAPLTGKALADTLEAGSDHSIWLKEGYVNIDTLDALPSEELLKRLVTWSPRMRVRVAGALARQTGNVVPALQQMIASTDRETMLGGLYGLESQGQRATPAIDQLVALLEHDDLWIRFRAGFALTSIGKAAKAKAVPAILRVAAQDVPGDVRQMNQRFMCFLLWGDGYNNSANGFLSKDMSGVDVEWLIPAVRSMVRNDSGQARGYLSRGLRRMPKQMQDRFWSEIIWAIRNPAPSAIMFNAEIRESGLDLLSQYRYRQTIPLATEYLMTMKEHGCQERIIWLMDLLATFGTEAKPMLPKLYSARDYYAKNLGPGKEIEFPQWATDQFMQGLNEGIRQIEATTFTPTDLQDLKL